jgi:hypothetical protein
MTRPLEVAFPTFEDAGIALDIQRILGGWMRVAPESDIEAITLLDGLVEKWGNGHLQRIGTPNFDRDSRSVPHRSVWAETVDEPVNELIWSSLVPNVPHTNLVRALDQIDNDGQMSDEEARKIVMTVLNAHSPKMRTPEEYDVTVRVGSRMRDSSGRLAFPGTVDPIATLTLHNPGGELGEVGGQAYIGRLSDRIAEGRRPSLTRIPTGLTLVGQMRTYRRLTEIAR